MSEKPLVSVLCKTYHHAPYLERALQGFVSQRTNFPFEVILHDDASTDGTAEICKKYAEAYPDIFVAILQTENQYSQGKRVILSVHARGKYIAFCEGDDYWCDPQKLQLQVDALEANPDCSFSTHVTRKITADGEDTEGLFPHHRYKGGRILSDTLVKNEIKKPWSFHLNSLLVRKSVYDDYIATCEYRTCFHFGDKPLLLYCMSHGNGYYIPREMSKYRVGVGIMTRTLADFERRLRFNEYYKEGYLAFNQATGGKYSKWVKLRVRYLEMEGLFIQGKYASILRPRYFRARRMLPWKRRLLVLAGVFFPKQVKKKFEAHAQRERK